MLHRLARLAPRRPAVLALLLAAAAPHASGASGKDGAKPSDRREPRSLLVRVGTLHVGDGTTHAPGQLLVVDGKVKAVGSDVEAPEGALAWEYRDAVLTPGLVEPAALVPLGGREGRAGLPNATLQAVDARSAHDPWLPIVRGDGVVAACLVPEADGFVAGRAATIGTTGPGRSGAPVLSRHAALVASMSLGAEGSASRAARREELAHALEQAEDYGKKRAEWRKAHPESKAPAERQLRRRAETGRRAAARGGAADPKEPKEQPAQEVLLRVLEKKLPLRVHATRREDVAALLALAKARSLHVTVTGCTECGALAPELSESRAIVLLEPLTERATETPWGEPDSLGVASLAQAGARIAVSGGGAWPHGPSWLRLAAAELAGRGLPPALAVAAMTGTAAEAAGIGKTHGKLAPGRDATFVLWSADPLDPRARVERLVTPADCRAAVGSGPPEAAGAKDDKAAADAPDAHAPEDGGEAKDGGKPADGRAGEPR